MVPGFILKLWKMINDPQCDDLICWSDSGQSFIIADPPKFSQELSKYFKHNNLSSFIRQLNMYGFRKVATIENSGLHPVTDDLHFYHNDFVRDHPEKLEAIKRKLPQKISENIDLRGVIKGISEIEGKQKDVSKTLADIKRENEMLWAEIHDLRQKHHQQQLYISRLMKLVFEAMEQNGIKTNMIQLKRNSPLMIEGGDDQTEANVYQEPTTSEYLIPLPANIQIDQAQIQQIQHVDSPIDQSQQQQHHSTQLQNHHIHQQETNQEQHQQLINQPLNEQDSPMDTLHDLHLPQLQEDIDFNGQQIDDLAPSIYTEENIDFFDN